MHYIAIDHNNNLTIAIMDQTFNIQDIIDMVSYGKFRDTRTTRSIWMLCDIKECDLTFDKMQELIEKLPTLNPNAFTVKRHLAIVVKQDLTYGIVRQAMVAAEFAKSKMEIMVCQTVEEATAWLELFCEKDQLKLMKGEANDSQSTENRTNERIGNDNEEQNE